MLTRKNTVLVAIINKASDFEIVRDQRWYRIPVASAPPMIRNGEAEIIGFYETKAYTREQPIIRWYAEVRGMTKVKRKELFPKEIPNPKTEKEYYKIEIGALKELPIPIVSLRPRRVVFIPTSIEKFFSVKEVNFLYNTTKLEDTFWLAMLKRNIFAERQYHIKTTGLHYFMDFALFCRQRNIDVEVDGGVHMEQDQVEYDKKRNNLLEKEGWSVLRFTSKMLEYNLDTQVQLVAETIDKYGGLQDLSNPKTFNYVIEDAQQRLFS